MYLSGICENQINIIRKFIKANNGSILSAIYMANSSVDPRTFFPQYFPIYKSFRSKYQFIALNNPSYRALFKETVNNITV